MKKFVYFSLVILTFCSCNNEDEGLSTDLINIAPNANNNRSSEDLPEIEFEVDSYDFGKILEGQIVEFEYKFENTGQADLIISDVKTTCGCTTAKDWSQKPYKPGEKGTITVVFDSDKKAGINKKTITILTNTVPSVTKVTLEGEVIGPK